MQTEAYPVTKKRVKSGTQMIDERYSEYFIVFINFSAGSVARPFPHCLPTGAYQEVRWLRQTTREKRLCGYPESSQESYVWERRKEVSRSAVFWGNQALRLGQDQPYVNDKSKLTFDDNACEKSR